MELISSQEILDFSRQEVTPGIHSKEEKVTFSDQKAADQQGKC